MTGLNNLEKLLSELDEKDIGTANKLDNWLSKYAEYLRYEHKFKSKKHWKYKRGSIIKAELGFRVGNEFGGLHYCIVLNINDSPKNSNLIVVPMTSYKIDKKLSDKRLLIGNVVYNTIKEKLISLKANIDELDNEHSQLLVEIIPKLRDIDQDGNENDFSEELQHLADLSQSIEKLRQKAFNIENEIGRMKQGSVVLIDQILTISKMRISDPLSNNDALSGIILPKEEMQSINEAIKKNIIFD